MLSRALWAVVCLAVASVLIGERSVIPLAALVAIVGGVLAGFSFTDLTSRARRRGVGVAVHVVAGIAGVIWLNVVGRGDLWNDVLDAPEPWAAILLVLLFASLSGVAWVEIALLRRLLAGRAARESVPPPGDLGT